MEAGAGCIVVKKFNGVPHILMVRAASKWNSRKLGFPKGKVKKSESLKAAATRETREETGIKVSILDYLGSVKGKKKEVHAYIAMYDAGALKGKDAIDYQRKEVSSAKFYPFDQAYKMAYNYQKPILDKAKAYIDNNP